MSFTTHSTPPKPRLLTVTESCRWYPRITITGAWLREWGFAIGDSVILMHTGPAEILIKIGLDLDHVDLLRCRPKNASRNPEIRQGASYSLSPSRRGCPQIVIAGAWLRNWGFAIGDRVSLTLTSANHIIMKLAMPRAQWREILQKQRLEKRAASAAAVLARHKAIHPDLYPDEAPKPARKRVHAFRPAKPTQPSLLDQLSAPLRDTGAAVAARSANAPVQVS